MTSQWSRVCHQAGRARSPAGFSARLRSALTTLLIAAFIIAYAIQGGSTEEGGGEHVSGEPVLSGEGMQRRVEHTIEERQRLEQLRKAAQARDRLRIQMQQPDRGQQPAPGRPPVRTAGLTGGQTTLAGGSGSGDPS